MPAREPLDASAPRDVTSRRGWTLPFGTLADGR
jgi:hypothetical protein